MKLLRRIEGYGKEGRIRNATIWCRLNVKPPKEVKANLVSQALRDTSRNLFLKAGGLWKPEIQENKFYFDSFKN